MPASEPPGPRGGLRVLLVEDENLVALLLEDMLADLGHSVVGPVARLKKALEIAQREAIDLAVLDVNINGEEFLPDRRRPRGARYSIRLFYWVRQAAPTISRSPDAA